MTSPSDGAASYWAAVRRRFRRLRPLGSPTWNFAAAFRRLEAAWGEASAGAAPGAAGVAGDGENSAPPAPPAPPGRGVRRVADQVAVERARRFVRFHADAVVAAQAPAIAGEVVRRRVDEGAAMTVEAIRFLAARVEQLEAALEAEERPVDGAAWLVPEVPAGWEPSVAAALAGSAGPVLHAECGAGGLLLALGAAGVTASGVDPRPPVAAAAARRGCDVAPGTAAEALAATAAGSLGAVVLSGVVDREPLRALRPLVTAAAAALAPGGVLVVVSAGPAALDGWPPQARDLVPGRPLHPETWELLLGRAGFADVGRRADVGAAAGGPPGGPYVVTAVAP